jgi:hypothetical protein
MPKLRFMPGSETKSLRLSDLAFQGFDSASPIPLTDLASMLQRGNTHSDTIRSLAALSCPSDPDAVVRSLQNQWSRSQHD